MDQVKAGDTVRVHYTGMLDDGRVFDSSPTDTPLEFTVGSDELIKGFHDAVVGMKPGESKTERVDSARAFGPYQDALRLEVDQSLFSAEGVTPEVGMQLEVRNRDGNGVPVRVTDVADSRVTLDANHPLAGQDLMLDIQLVEIVKSAGSSIPG